MFWIQLIIIKLHEFIKYKNKQKIFRFSGLWMNTYNLWLV